MHNSAAAKRVGPAAVDPHSCTFRGHQKKRAGSAEPAQPFGCRRAI